MEAISNHAKRAAQREQERRYSESDLEQCVGATIGNAYLVQPDDDDDFVMVITGITHTSDQMDDGRWRRPMGVSEDEFERGIQVEADFYSIHSIRNGAYVTNDDPFRNGARLYKEALKHFPRKRLETGRQDGTYALPSLSVF